MTLEELRKTPAKNLRMHGPYQISVQVLARNTDAPEGKVLPVEFHLPVGAFLSLELLADLLSRTQAAIENETGKPVEFVSRQHAFKSQFFANYGRYPNQDELPSSDDWDEMVH